MLAITLIIATPLALLAYVGLRRAQAPANAGLAPLARTPAVGATLAAASAANLIFDARQLNDVNNVVTERLWRLAFAVSAEVAVVNPTDTAVQDAVFAALRAEELDPRFLPRRPTLLPQLLRAINDEKAASDRLSQMVAHDPVLTADVLRLANSSLYLVSSTPIETIQRAIVVLGVDALRGVVATAMLEPVFRATRTNFPRFPRLLWERTARASRAAELFALETRPDDRFEAQLLALLSALGPLVVYGAILDVYARRMRTTPNPALCAALVHSLGSPLSQRIAKHWQLSARLLAALEGRGDEGLATALRAGELLGTLSLLEAQTVITRDERIEWGRSAGLADGLVHGVYARLTGE
jgi:HD-like signal output (HDOD) protein